MTWWDNIVNTATTSGDFLGSVFNTVAGTVGGLITGNAQQEQNEQLAEDAKAEKLLALQLEMLKYKYGVGKGGGGGGGGGANTRLTPAQQAQMMQNQADTKMTALQNMISSYSGAIR